MLDTTFQDIPGTFVFTGERAIEGRHLNRFCMSLMSAANRTRFKADERAYLDEWQMTESQKQAVLRRDFRALLEQGGNIFFVLKIAAVDGRPTQSVAASFAGQTTEEYAAMMRSGGRNPEGLRSISGRF
ncbi:MAG TPA: protocatechuate 4,5-dioxygenase subunit alpha [Steroidobacteraceae bacterium]|nr:protocatechuate 4,5-dioxygenase subunit alpha [Steroidobacteraceae bacterium]